jgi:hypothetical protein
MRIEEDSCYIKHYVHSNEDLVGIILFKEICEDGYRADTYIIDPEYISFENVGYVTIQEEVGTYVKKEQFVRWIEKIKQAKETAAKMLRQAAIPITRNIEVGDYILYPWNRDEDSEGHHNDYFVGMRVVEINNNCLYVQSIYVNSYCFDSADDLDWTYESLEYIQSRSCLITAEAFMATHDYIRNFCRFMLDETKSHAKITEQL